jgi:hypothetical protein
MKTRQMIEGSPTLTAMFNERCNELQKLDPDRSRADIEKQVLAAWERINKNSMKTSNAMQGRQILCVPPQVFEQMMNGTFDNSQFKNN